MTFYKVPGDQKEKDQYIVDCFDGLFYYMSTLEHYINSSLVIYEDVAFPLDYYMPLLAEFASVIDPYLDKYEQGQARRFLDRYPAWTEAVGRCKDR